MNVVDERLEAKILSGADFNKVYDSANNSCIVSFVNPYSYRVVSLCEDSSVVNEVDYWFSDGALLCGLIGVRRRQSIQRASFDFSSVAKDVFRRCMAEKSRVAIVGGAPGEVDIAVQNIKLVFPGIDFVFSSHGYFDAATRDGIIDLLVKSRPDVIVVGMGTPAQEIFSIDCRRKLVSPARIFTCGGFVTQTAAKPDYYHPLIKKTGLRWLQRAWEFPHVRTRLFNDYPSFFIKYLCDILSERLKFN